MVFCHSSSNGLKTDWKEESLLISVAWSGLLIVVPAITSPSRLGFPTTWHPRAFTCNLELQAWVLTVKNVLSTPSFLTAPQKSVSFSLHFIGNLRVTGLSKFKGTGHTLYLLKWKMSMNLQPIFKIFLTSIATGPIITSKYLSEALISRNTYPIAYSSTITKNNNSNWF